MATLREILSMNAQERRRLYEARDIAKVEIDGNTFTDYGAFSFLWEKSFSDEPTRSTNGVMIDLDTVAWFVTPHLKIDFSLLSIDSYRQIMKLIYSKNEFVVTCYDVVYNTTISAKMYFATEEMPKLFTIARALNGEEWVELLGVEEYTVELIGTNREVEYVNLQYSLNLPINVSWGGTTYAINVDVAQNSTIVIGDDALFTYYEMGEEKTSLVRNIVLTSIDGTKKYKFKNWRDSSGFHYIDGQSYFMRNSTNLFAQWEEFEV